MDNQPSDGVIASAIDYAQVQDPLETFSLLNYLDALDDNPAMIVDVSQAAFYSSYASAHEQVANNRPPIRIHDNPCMKRIFGEKEWIVEVLTPTSILNMQNFLLELSRNAYPSSLALDFNIPDLDVVASGVKDATRMITVTFMTTTVEQKKLPKSLQTRYSKGFIVLIGKISAPHVELPPLPSNHKRDGPNSYARPLQQDQVSLRASSRRSSEINQPTVLPAEIMILHNFDPAGLGESAVQLSETETGTMLLNFPWHETSLGPFKSWPAPYKTYATFCLSMPVAACVGLGNDLVFIYNDLYKEVIGAGHPYLFGQSIAKVGGNFWKDSMGPIVTKAMRERKALQKENHLVWMQRLDKWQVVGTTEIQDQTSHGYGNTRSMEETYHSFAYIPLIPKASGEAVGFFATDRESTDTVIAQRRLATARDLGLAVAPATNLKSFYALIAEGLNMNPLDVPFLLVYSCTAQKAGMDIVGSGTNELSTLPTTTGTGSTNGESSEPPTAFTGTLSLRLQSSCGLPDRYQKSYHRFLLDLDDSDKDSDIEAPSGLPFPFQSACRHKDLTHTFLRPEIAAHFAARSWDQISHQAVICPIRTDHKSIPELVIVIGLNSRRTYDRPYARWIEELCRSLSSTLSTVKNLAREQKHLANLLKLDQAKTAFFTGVSHELRSPLTIIAGPAMDALMETDLNPRDRSRFTLIARASSRLLRLVNSILDFASVEAGKTTVAFQPVYLGHYVADLASLFRSAAERVGLKYHVNCSGEEIAYTDVVAYEKIIYNLVSNALKYTRRGHIEITLRTTEHHHILEVADTGIGIPEDELSRVFTRFHRVENRQAKNIEGSGIGLALTRELARLIKGEMTVESKLATENEAGYSRFRLTIPVGHAHLPDDLINFEETPIGLGGNDTVFSRRAIADELSNAFEGSGTVSVDDTRASITNGGEELASEREANVLVVDDNDDVRGYVSSILGAVCRSVTAVNDGEAALAILKTNARIDLVVSDIMMPRLDGFGLLSAIRKDERLQHMPVILLSARAGSEATAEGIELGATDYLPKPFSSKELTARVRNALQNAKHSMRLEALVEERTAELFASERRAEALMSILPVGVYEVNAAGIVTWINEAWKKMSQWPEDRIPFQIKGWLSRVSTSDRDKVAAVLDRALGHEFDDNPAPYVVEWQWEQKEGAIPSWCYGQIFPQGDGYVGVLTDVTPSRRLAEQALAHEKARADDALNLARSQESFLDVISHELRNPLSAILNAADLANANHESIAISLDNLADLVVSEEGQNIVDEARTELDEAVESVQGVIASARHQSFVAGDILSVSRFNRGLLTVTPIDISLSAELQTIITVFEIQTRNNGIDLQLKLIPPIDSDFFVHADPTRLNQILINLISNSCRILESYDGIRCCSVEVHAFPTAPSLSAFHQGTDATLKSLAIMPGLPQNVPIGTDIWLLFLVRDTGPGISSATQSSLFTKFNRIQDKGAAMDSTRSAHGGGAGLGLYLAKKLAELMGGAITVVSEIGKGADFIFYIKSAKARYVEPRKPTKTRLRISKNANRAGLNNHPGSARSVNRKESKDDSVVQNLPVQQQRREMRVLVVEDNLLNQKLLQRQLTKAGLAVLTANNGLEALDRLHKAAADNIKIDVCLMDLEMPLMGGLEASVKIRGLEMTGQLQGHLQILAVTGNAREFFVTEAKKAGMDDVITKPYRFPDILSRLDNLSLSGSLGKAFG